MNVDPFLEAICADPSDHATRLVYADWLEENGRPVHAEFIRAQFRLAKLGNDCLASEERGQLFRRALRMACDRCEACLLRKRMDVLLAKRECDWPPEIVDAVGIGLRLGFVEYVECDWAAWNKHHGAWCAQWPLRTVKLIDMPVLVRAGDFWHLEGHPEHLELHIDRWTVIRGLLKRVWPKLEIELP